MVVSFRDHSQRNMKEGLVSGVEVYTVEPDTCRSILNYVSRLVFIAF